MKNLRKFPRDSCQCRNENYQGWRHAVYYGNSLILGLRYCPNCARIQVTERIPSKYGPNTTSIQQFVDYFVIKKGKKIENIEDLKKVGSEPPKHIARATGVNEETTKRIKIILEKSNPIDPSEPIKGKGLNLNGHVASHKCGEETCLFLDDPYDFEKVVKASTILHCFCGRKWNVTASKLFRCTCGRIYSSIDSSVYYNIIGSRTACPNCGEYMNVYDTCTCPNCGISLRICNNVARCPTCPQSFILGLGTTNRCRFGNRLICKCGEDLGLKSKSALIECDRCGTRYIIYGGFVNIEWELNGKKAPMNTRELWGEPLTVQGKINDSISGQGMPKIEVRVMLSQWPYWGWQSIGYVHTDEHGYFKGDLSDKLKKKKPGWYAISLDPYFNKVEFRKSDNSWIYLDLLERPADIETTHNQKYASVLVSVKDGNDLPVRNCPVILSSSVKGATDHYGQVHFRFLPLDRYKLVINLLGYLPYVDNVNALEPFITYNINVNLPTVLEHAVNSVNQAVEQFVGSLFG